MTCPSCGAPGAYVSFNLTHCPWKGCKNYDENLQLFSPEDSEFDEWRMKKYKDAADKEEQEAATSDIDARIDEVKP